jgi:hypothetical protein
MALIPPFFLNTVVAIGEPAAGSDPRWIATGFLYGNLIDPSVEPNQYRVYLVTNRHVANPLRPLVVWMNPNAEGPAEILNLQPFETPSGRPFWHFHPDDEIDVAVIGVDIGVVVQKDLEYGFFESNHHAQTLAEMKASGSSVGDGVFLLGFPGATTLGSRSTVIVRNGCIARLDDAMAGESKSFLIDSNNFPGNSGGPVVTKIEQNFITGTQGVVKSNLIGIVASYVAHQDFAVSSQTGRVRVVFEENTGLAEIYPVDAIRDVVEIAERQLITEPELPEPSLNTESSQTPTVDD